MKGARWGLTTDSENTNRVVVRVKCKSECYLGKIMAPIVKTSPSYIKERKANTYLKFFVTSISSAKTTLFSLWI